MKATYRISCFILISSCAPSKLVVRNVRESTIPKSALSIERNDADWLPEGRAEWSLNGRRYTALDDVIREINTTPCEAIFIKSTRKGIFPQQQLEYVAKRIMKKRMFYYQPMGAVDSVGWVKEFSK